MNEDTIITVDNVSKAFPVYERPVDMLKEAVFGGVKHDVFWALRNISFQVRKKQRVGIIGPNGAGKSTLLQIIASVLQPTSGQVMVKGRVSSLLGLAPQWNTEENGIENIRFNLTLQGCAAQDIDSLVDEIIEFTELDPFIRQPVRTYSDGMRARLAFAIATAVEPQVLIVDEVLATGDAYFINRAHRRMRNFCDRGQALLFVSHSMDAIQRLCDVVIRMDQGTILSQGAADEVCRGYVEDAISPSLPSLKASDAGAQHPVSTFVRRQELADPNWFRIRLFPKANAPIRATHYVQDMTLELDGDQSIALSLEATGREENHANAKVDLYGSEWGRLVDRRGVRSRILASNTGRLAGGQVLIARHTLTGQGKPETRIRFSFTAASFDAAEELTAQYVDENTGKWESMELVRQTHLDGEWERRLYEATIRLAGENERRRVADVLNKNDALAGEIVEIAMRADGRTASVVKELVSFEVAIRIRANVPLRQLSVNLLIHRRDGMLMFRQNTAQVDQIIDSLTGEAEVVYRFEPNCIGSGTYDITANLARCAPESDTEWETLDRKAAACRFHVEPSSLTTDSGAICMRVPVAINLR